MRIMILALVMTAWSSASFADDFGQCGEAVEIESYRIRFGSLDVAFPSFVEIVVDGRSVVADEKPMGWVHPYNGLSTAEAGGYLLVETLDQDCVDFSFRRIYVLSKDGDLVGWDHVWTMNWEDAFFFEGDNLVYWSAWFCHPENSERTVDRSYVYVWPGAGEFRRVARPSNAICSEDGVETIRGNRIQFTPVDPAQHGIYK